MTDVVELESTSLESLQFTVSAKVNSSYVDPTSGTTKWAFVAHEAIPTSGDWKAASWETDNSGARPVYRSVVLVGPGGGVQSFTTGYYDVWGRVQFSGQDIQRKLGVLICNPDLVDGI